MSCLHGAPALLLLGCLAGCFQGTVDGTGVGGCPGCHGGGTTTAAVKKGGTSGATATPTTSATTRGGTSTPGGSSGSLSTGGGGSSGSTQGGSSTGGAATTSCQPPLLEMDAHVYDASANMPIAGVAVSAITMDGVPISGSAVDSRSDGSFALCLPGGEELALQLQANGYPTTYVANFLLSGPLGNFGGRAGVPLISSEFLAAMATVIGVGDPTSQAAMFVGIGSVSGNPPCYENNAGWSVALKLADGGVLGDGGDVPAERFYTDNSGFPMAGLAATGAKGIALFFEVDTGYSNVLSLQASNPDAGACPFDLSAFQLTGRVYTALGALTIGLFPTP